MTEEVIVCNAGPLIALATADALELLNQLYGKVLVPTAVLAEVTGSARPRPGARELEDAAWIEIVTPREPVDPLLRSELGAGEAAVISVARSTGADLVLLDERRARRIAEQAYSLKVKGSLGILAAAKKRSLIPAVRPLLHAMVTSGYHLSERLIEQTCRAVGEALPDE